ncbi:MAG: GatB/YqeY domain-containing protein [Firmicutes bacterium]|nr:GatB/YqeY domain-containing protein [Bacillota bacterium]MDY5041582.1 GatB/YqeY domain-containing protein [Eubacteriales bacterium]
MIIEEIKKANVQAMKNKDQNLRSIYSVVINKYMQAQIEARLLKKDVNDDDMIRIIQKTIKELDEEANNYEKVGHIDEANNIRLQRGALEGYLPKMLTADEIHAIILTLPDRSIPGVMKHFKQNYGSRVDMKMVSDELKNF